MKDPLFSNKIAGALLASGLLFFGLPQLAEAVLGGGHHGHGDELKLAYPIEFEGAGTVSAGGAAVADLGTLLAAADPVAGKRRAALCTSCHNFDKGGANLQGPNLWGLVGRAVGTHPGFNYSAANKALGGAWTYDRLDVYLTNPAKYAPGTSMSFAGIAKPQQRAELLAYLKTLSDNPVDFPPPTAPPEVAAEPGAEPGGVPAAAPAKAAETPQKEQGAPQNPG